MEQEKRKRGRPRVERTVKAVPIYLEPEEIAALQAAAAAACRSMTAHARHLIMTGIREGR